MILLWCTGRTSDTLPIDVRPDGSAWEGDLQAVGCCTLGSPKQQKFDSF